MYSRQPNRVNIAPTIQTSGGGSGGRPITFATSRWDPQAINKRQRRLSIEEPKSQEQVFRVGSLGNGYPS
jgi:hypothetical protein